MLVIQVSTHFPPDFHSLIFLIRIFSSTLSTHYMPLFSSVTLAKQIKEVSAIPGFSLNRLSESSSWLSERNAGCLFTQQQDATPWQNTALGLWNQGTLNPTENDWTDSESPQISPSGPLFTWLWVIPLLDVISDTTHPFLWSYALAKLR